MTHQTADFTLKSMATASGATPALRALRLGLVELILALISPAALSTGLQAGHSATAQPQ